MKTRSEGAKLFHADGQTERETDMTKLIVAFHNFADAPKKRERIWFDDEESALRK